MYVCMFLLRKLYFLAYQSFLLISLSFSSLVLIAFLIKEASLSQLSGNLSIVAIMLSLDNREPTCTVSSLLSCSCTGQANIACSSSSPSSPHSIEPCSQSTHSLIFGMSLCVHFPSFDKPHSSCHLLKRVSLAFARMMFLSSLCKCSCLSRYSSSSTQIPFRSRASNLIGGTPESTFAASLDNVRTSTDYAQIHLALHCAHMFIH